MNISRRTFELLKLSGWHPGRKIECTGILEYLKNKGFIVNALIISFLEEFGQLEFDLINPYDDTSFDKHHTHVKKAIGNYRPFDFKYFEELFKEKVVPVGELFNRHLYILISESGNIYTDLGLIGRDYMTAFENIFTRKILEPLESTNMGILNNSHILSIITDRTMPEMIYANETKLQDDDVVKIKFASNSGIFGFNPYFKPEKRFQRLEEYKDYYKLGLTDAGIDRILKEDSEIFRGKDVDRIREELLKLRRAILGLKTEAKHKNAQAFDGSNSFEIWPVEHCAEIWAARNAILSGIRFENIAFSVIRQGDKGILNMCSNCRRVFEGNYKVKSI